MSCYKMRNIYLALLSVLVIMVGCEVERSPAERPSAVYYPPFAVETQSVNRESGNCETDTSRNCTQVALLYQTVADTARNEAVKKINQEIRMTMLEILGYDSIDNATPEGLADVFIEDYRSLANDFPEAFGWVMNVSGEVLRNDSSFLVVRIQTEAYTGGAHGNYSLQFLNFNPVTGDVVKLSDLFAADYEETLNKLALRSFQDARNIPAGADLAAEGFSFADDRYYNPDNFAILKDQMLFYFNNYEIAPYSAGPTTIAIQLEELEGILRI